MQHSVPDIHLKSIGDITVSFSLLEWYLQIMVGSLLDENQKVSKIITSELSFKGVKALLMSLYIEKLGKDDADYNQLKGLLNRCGQAEGKRNQITHSMWGVGKNTDLITRIKTTAKEKHGIRFQNERMSPKDIEGIASEINQLTKELVELWIVLVVKGKFKDHLGLNLP
jgi:hypothetical protein